MKEETFSRFKYAEEAAHKLDQQGVRTWTFSRGADKVFEEGGEIYMTPTYIVRWTT